MLTISGLKKFYFVPDINDMRCGAHRLLEIVKHRKICKDRDQDPEHRVRCRSAEAGRFLLPGA